MLSPKFKMTRNLSWNFQDSRLPHLRRSWKSPLFPSYPRTLASPRGIRYFCTRRPDGGGGGGLALDRGHGGLNRENGENRRKPKGIRGRSDGASCQSGCNSAVPSSPSKRCYGLRISRVTPLEAATDDFTRSPSAEGKEKVAVRPWPRPGLRFSSR